MAAHYRDNILHGHDHTDQHLDQGRWRHQESGSYARHASPRRPNGLDNGSKDLADFFNKDRIDPPQSAGSGGAKSKPIMVAGNAHNGSAGPQTEGEEQDGISGRQAAEDTHTLEVKCGPLLNYRRMEKETWFGSVLVVTKGGGSGESHPVPELRWTARESKLGAQSNGHIESGVSVSNGASINGRAPESHGIVNGVDYGTAEPAQSSTSEVPSIAVPNGGGAIESSIAPGRETRVLGTKLYSDPQNTFWRFDLVVPMQQAELRCDYKIPSLIFPSGQKKSDAQHFFIPAITDSMRIMFHSCNGFSVGTDEDAWSGAALWNDVLRVHEKTPFHVMYESSLPITMLETNHKNTLGLVVVTRSIMMAFE